MSPSDSMDESSVKIWEQVRRIAADIFNVAPADLTPESSPEMLENWDSLQHLNLVMDLEAHFGITLEPEEIQEMKSLAMVVEILKNKQSI